MCRSNVADAGGYSVRPMNTHTANDAANMMAPSKAYEMNSNMASS